MDLGLSSARSPNRHGIHEWCSVGFGWSAVSLGIPGWSRNSMKPSKLPSLCRSCGIRCRLISGEYRGHKRGRVDHHNQSMFADHEVVRTSNARPEPRICTRTPPGLSTFCLIANSALPQRMNGSLGYDRRAGSTHLRHGVPRIGNCH